MAAMTQLELKNFGPPLDSMKGPKKQTSARRGFEPELDAKGLAGMEKPPIELSSGLRHIEGLLHFLR